MEVSIDGSDLKVLEDFFDSLGRKDQRKVLMASYRKAVKPLLSVARGTVPKTSLMGLYRSLGTEEVAGDTAIFVGSKMNTQTIRREYGRNLISKVWYAHLVELGTGQRSWRRARKVRKGFYKGQMRGGGDSAFGHFGKSTGAMPASHFWENALNATEDQVFNIAGKEWYDEIERFINRTNKRGR